MNHKAICFQLLEADHVVKLANDPAGASKRVLNNKKVNGNKKIKAEQGKEALKAVEVLKSGGTKRKADFEEEGPNAQRVCYGGQDAGLRLY